MSDEHDKLQHEAERAMGDAIAARVALATVIPYLSPEHVQSLADELSGVMLDTATEPVREALGDHALLGLERIRGWLRNGADPEVLMRMD